MAIEIELRGLQRVQDYFKRAPGNARTAARFALIDTLRFARRESSKRIRDQVKLSAGYLGNERKGTLNITKFPREGDLEGVITGRNRPTSLARYKRGTLSRGKPVRVQVSTSGGRQTLKGAFPVRLPQGSAAVREDRFNEGIAIRLKPGERVRGKTKPLGKTGLVLLYGPSVGQVFRDVSREIEGEASDRLEQNFVRQFERVAKL